MTKIKTFREVYNFDGWIVIIASIRNGSKGQPRWEVQIFNSENVSDCSWALAHTFHFQGHYRTSDEEAKWALEQYFEYLSKKYGK